MNKEPEDIKFTVSRLEDICNISSKQCVIKSSSFLNPAEQEAVYSINPDAQIQTMLWGGYDDAERRVFIASPDYFDPEELKKAVAVLKVTNNYTKALTHRDYLGSVLGLGIKREKTGDIIVSDHTADICEFIKDNLKKVGNVSVKTELTDVPVLNTESYKLHEFTVASLRLDAVLAGVMKSSRNAVSNIIKNENVRVNFKICDNISYVLSKDDLISVKGFGRIRVVEIGSLSKKGRTHICVKQLV